MELTIEELKFIQKILQGFVDAKAKSITQSTSMTETVEHAKELGVAANLLDKVKSATAPYTSAQDD